MKTGDTVLVRAAASGVGTAAVQIAKFFGCTVCASCSNVQKLEFCKELGADLLINYLQQSHLEILGQNSVDLILDVVGADSFSEHLQLLRPKGRIVIIAVMGGHKIATSILPMLTKCLNIKGSVLRSRSDAEKNSIIQKFKMTYQHQP